MNFRILICCICFFLIGCGQKKDNVYLPKIYRNIDYDKIGIKSLRKLSVTAREHLKSLPIDCEMLDEKYFLNNLVDSIWYAPLETTEECIIGEISKIIPILQNYVIFDRTKAKAVYIFNKEGRFLKKIGKPGKGPGEYLEITDVVVNENNHVVLYDRKKGLLMTYDAEGLLLKETRVNASFRDFADLNGSYLFHIYNDYNLHIPEINSSKLLACDSECNLLSTALPYDRQADGKFGYFPQSGNLKKFGASILFCSPLTDTIYSISDPNTIVPRYALDFGQCGLSEDFKMKKAQETFVEELKKSDRAYFLGQMLETNNILYLSLTYNGKKSIFFYSKKESRWKGGESVVDDHPGSLGFRAPLNYQADTFISYVDAMDIVKTTEFYKTQTVASKKTDVLNFGKTVKGEDNPVLIFYTLNDF
jgi:hypothetical protein